MDCTRCKTKVVQVWSAQCPTEFAELVFCSCLCLFEALREAFGDEMQKLKFSRTNSAESKS